MSDTVASYVNKVNAVDVDSSQLDPKLAQSILTKVASGAPLTPDEKAAAAKLPPATIAHAANAGTAPLPNSFGSENYGGAPATSPKQAPAPNSAVSTNYSGAPGAPRLAYDVPVHAPSEGQPVGQDVGGRSFGPPMGNQAENQGMLANGHYAGEAKYNGSMMTDPITQKPVPAIAPSVTSAAPVATAAPASAAAQTPNVAVAQEIAKKMPDLKKLSGQDIAQLIGNILDVVGVGFSARGGVNRQTMLQHQQELQRTTGAAIGQKQAETAIQLDADIKKAHAEGDIATENEIRKAKGLAPINLANEKELQAYIADLDVNAKKRLFKELGIQPSGSQVSMGLYTNPSQYGASQAATITPPNP